MTATCDAFVCRFDKPIRNEAAQQAGALAGLAIGVKDNVDIAGMVTGAGNPEFAADQPPAAANATVVDLLLAQGAVLVGKTQMDELAYSLMGLNARYGVPANAAAIDRVPGGSSSGSASAVAAGLVDIGLGTDTGGSVRLPASFCGLYGWRSTHGLISAQGMVPLAPSYDVCGFFTRDLGLMARLMGVFAPDPATVSTLRYWLPSDMWALPMEETSRVLRADLPDLDDCQDPILPEGQADACLTAFRLHQGYEIWQQFGPWVTKRQPEFGPGIKERFAMASRITQADFADASAYRLRLRQHLAPLLDDNTVLVYPTAPGPAPLLSTPQSALEPYRNRALSAMALAGHAGLPQLSIPFSMLDGAPIGLSVVGRPGSDLMLLRAATEILSLRKGQ